MKYDPKDFDDRLREEMENVEQVYSIYKEDEESNEKYWELKKAVYALSLAVKTEKVSGILSASKAQEINEYYWSLLL